MAGKNKKNVRYSPANKSKPSKSRLWISLPAIFVGIAAFLASQYFSKYEPYKFSIPPARKFEGVLARNSKLNDPEILLKDQINGPESLLIEGNTIYTGTEDGLLVKIVDGKVVKSIPMSTDEKCKTSESRLKHHNVCGRPLGLRRLNNDELIFADSYLGVVKVNLETEKTEIVLKRGTPIEGIPLNFADDLDVVDEHTVIFSDATTKWDLDEVMVEFLENAPNGRAVMLNLKNGETRVILDKMFFANGIQMFPDKKSVLIAESTLSRITRYYLEGPKKGQHEIFIDNLPGVPDNIRLNSKRNFYIPLPAIRDPDVFDVREFLAPYPLIIPLSVFEKAATSIGFFIEVDQNGTIVDSFHCNDGKMSVITQASDDGNFIYLAGLTNKYLARLQKTQ